MLQEATVLRLAGHSPDLSNYRCRLGHAPQQCIGIEDSFAGLQSVRDSGMYTVAIATTHTAAELAVAKPDVIVQDYEELMRHFAL